MIDPHQGFLRPHSQTITTIARLIDLAIVGGGLWVVAFLYGIPWTQDFTIAAALALLLFAFFSEVFSVYRSWRAAPLKDEIRVVLLVWSAILFGELLLGYATKTSAVYSRRVVFTWFVLAPMLLVTVRVAVRYYLWELRKKGRNTRTVAIAGAGEQARTLSRTIVDSEWLGLRLLGFYADDHTSDQQQADDMQANPVSVQGGLQDLVAKAKAGVVDLVYIALPMREEERIKSLVTELSDTTASLYFVPDIFVSGLIGSRWGSIGSMPVLSIHETPFFGADGILKRAEDIVVSSLILFIVTLPMLLIAAGIKLTSKGPVLFRQRRYGLDGKEILMCKFRTMTVTEDGEVIKQATHNDSRVTRFGAFLRRTSLDELPQFFNVLQGQMTVVGPRPHAVAHNEQYREQILGYMLRHKVKPGITGLAQVNGWRGETDTLDKMEKRIQHDLEYIRNWSLWLDLKIIFLTIFKGFSNKNAY